MKKVKKNKQVKTKTPKASDEASKYKAARENAVVIYQTSDNQTQVEVRFDENTVWLNRQQLSLLFDRDIKTIGKHINNVFKEEELDKKSVVANFATTAADLKTYQVEHYSLDVIISVGYRVKSKRGTQFRQWATQRLKDYLLQGYAVNQKRLGQLQQTIQLISKGGISESLQLGEAKGLLDIINNYTRSFLLLNQYDSNNLQKDKLNENISYEVQYTEARTGIDDAVISKMETTTADGKKYFMAFYNLDTIIAVGKIKKLTPLKRKNEPSHHGKYHRSISY